MLPPVPFRISLLALLFATAASAETARFALVVGSNAGSADLPPLRYAEADAGKVARVLVELGDVPPDNLVLLQGRKVGEVEDAIHELRARVARAKANPEARTVVLFYFSGHSDGEGIELGREALSYSRLKTLLGGTAADVRVTIVDACRSGRGTKEKGARPADPFTIRIADTLNTSGEAFISSSADDEAALESGEVLGSIFTHNLVSGLRGAADASGDKLITLGEAYRYAYDQTVARTALLTAGAQHPSYDYRLAGQGELVLTSLQKPSALLVLPEGAERSVITDVLRDQVVVEVGASAAREAALPPGQYGVRLFRGGQSFGGRFVLSDGARKSLSWDELAPIASSTQVARKGAEVIRAAPEPDWHERQVLAASVGVAPSVSQIGLLGLLRAAFEPRAGSGLSVALVGARAQAPSVSETALEARGGWRWVWSVGPFFFALGAEAGPGLIWQTDPTGTGSAFAAVLAPRASARLSFGGPFALQLDGETALAFTVVEGRLTALFRPSATLGLAVRF